MTTAYIGTTDTGPKVIGGDVVGSATGGTLAGGQTVQVVFDNGTFGSTLEGKQRLLAALDIIRDRIAGAKQWPITSSS